MEKDKNLINKFLFNSNILKIIFIIKIKKEYKSNNKINKLIINFFTKTNQFHNKFY